jgi:threonine dehydrogenase-like Zn-dependent dehydrogenase
VTTTGACRRSTHLYVAAAETINFEEVKVYDRLMEMTTGRGPDRCLDAVGAEAYGAGSFDAIVDKAKAAVMLGTDRPHVLRSAIMSCRKGGALSIPGVYIGLLDKIPLGAAMNKIDSTQIDPSFVITHRMPLADAPAAYKTSRDKEDGCAPGRNRGIGAAIKLAGPTTTLSLPITRALCTGAGGDW